VDRAHHDGRRARVERRDGGWRLVEPLDFPADAVALDAVASTLAELAPERRLEDPQPLEVYGIAEDGRSLRFAAGGETRRLRIGRATPVGANTYVASDQGDDVYTVPTWRVNALDKSLSDLRDKRVLPFEQDAVVRLEARWPPDGRVVVARPAAAGGDEEAAAWRLVEPLEGPAHPPAIDGLLSDLAYLRAEGFVDEPPPDEEAGLAPPAFELVLHSRSAGDGDAGDGSDAALRERRFALGTPREDGTRLARGAVEGVLYEVPSERIADFPREVATYRDRRIARFASSEAARVELELAAPEGARRLVLARDEEAGGWALEDADADQRLAAGVVPALLDRLSGLDAVGIAADRRGDEERAALGLVPPRASLRVVDADGALLGAVRLGTLDAERGIAAMKPDGDVVYRLDAAAAEDLPISLEAWEARFVERPEPEPTAQDEADGAGGPGEGASGAAQGPGGEG